MTTSSIEPGFQGKTFDDFLFRPRRGVVSSRGGVPLRSAFTRRITLELPIVAANMDSVTGERMAQTLALEGGIGVVHRALSIELQAKAVAGVKRMHGHLVERPLSLPRDVTIGEAREFMAHHQTTGILIEERRGSGKLAGLLSNRDIPWIGDSEGVSVAQFMTPIERLVTARPGIAIPDAERLMFEHRIEKLPLTDEAGVIRGLITKKDIIAARRRPESTRDAKGRLQVAAAIGARGDFLERAAELLRAGADALVIDIAHGHSEVMQRAVEAVRARFDDVELVCGNVATADGARFLRDLGADAIKVGVGPGQGCRTRLETAAGVPQLQALREAWCAVGDAVPIVADGGVRHDKDLFLAIVCGASCVMLGSMLSGTDEAPGQVIEDPRTREKRKIYRGMTSPQAVLEAEIAGGASDAGTRTGAPPPEGQEVQVPYRGSVVDILGRIRGHLRSAVSYAGATSLAEARALVIENPTEHLIPLSEASRRESFER